MVFRDLCQLNPLRQQQPEAWFPHVEARFTFAKLTSQEIRLYYLADALAREFALKLFSHPVQPTNRRPIRRLKNCRPRTPVSTA